MRIIRGIFLPIRHNPLNSVEVAIFSVYISAEVADQLIGPRPRRGAEDVLSSRDRVIVYCEVENKG